MAPPVGALDPVHVTPTVDATDCEPATWVAAASWPTFALAAPEPVAMK
jgi:hypothetical protein